MHSTSITSEARHPRPFPRIRGFSPSAVVALLLLLFSALSASAQTQVGTLNATQPTFLAIDTDASGTRWLYVSQHGDVGGTTGGIVLKYNLTTGSTTGIPLTSHGTADGQFISPDGIAIDPATHDLYVADRFLNRVQRLHNDGTFVMKWGTATTGAPDEMHGPCGLAIDSTGAVYLAEHGEYNGDVNHIGQHIAKYTISGTTAQKQWRVGSWGNGDGQFNSTGPYGMALSGGNVYVADAFNFRVQAFSMTTGAYQSQFSVSGGAEPLGLSIDSTGALWVAETSNSAPSSWDGQGPLQQVQKFTTSGTYAGVTLPGVAGQLSAFHAVVDGVTNKAYVTNYQQSYIAVFDLNSPTASAPVVSNATVTGTVGTPITNVQVSATNSPTSFSAPGLAPYGLSISASGVISGTPTATATNATVAVTATNAAGTSTPASITLTLSPSSTPPPSGPVVTSFTYVAHTLTFTLAFNEPVTGVDLSDFVFTPTGYATGQLDSVTQNDASHYTLNFTFYSGAPGSFAIDLKTSGTGIVGVNSGLPYTGAGITKAVVPVTPHLETNPPTVVSFTPQPPVGNTVNFLVEFSKESWNIQPSNITINKTGSATATLGYIVPADNSSKFYTIPVTFSGSGTISLTLSNPAPQTISDGNYNYYVGPDTSGVFTIPATTGNPPVVSNAVVEGTVGTAIAPVQVYATNSPTRFTADLTAYGLSIDATGKITGTPTASANNAVVNVTATNAYGTSAPATITLLISGSTPPPSVPVVSNASVTGTVGTPIANVQVQATNSPTSFSAPGLATYGLAISNTGVISGTPTKTAAGVAVSVTASNSAGTSAAATITLTLSSSTPPPSLPVVSNASVTGTVGTPIAAVQVQATNSPTSFSAPGLATYGLAISNTGVISGTPSSTASAVTVSVTASNSAGQSAPATITLTISNPTPPPPPPMPPKVSAVTLQGVVGEPLSYTVEATNNPTSYSMTGQPQGMSISSTGLISGTPTVSGTFIATVTATNADGSGQATITFRILRKQHLVFALPTSSVTVGEVIQLGATTDSGLPITYTVISGPATVTGNSLLITGSSAVVVRASVTGNAVYSPASADASVTAAKAVQRITTNAPASVHTDGKLTLSAASSSGLPLTYTLVQGPATVSGNTVTFTGSGTVVIRATQAGNDTYAATSTDVTVTANPVPRLTNISTRAKVTARDAGGATIAGFYVSGSAPKQILVRGIGPGLAQFGVNGVLSNPTLTLYDNKGVVVATNSGWANDAKIAAAGDAVGAFKLVSGSKDAAILATLAPGAYTAQVQSDSDNGAVLIEAYDVDSNAAVPTKQLINISTRGNAGSGENAIFGGFYVSGNEPKKVLIRAVGPGLAQYNVSGVLADPVVKVYDSQGHVIATNDNWGAQLAPASAADITAAETATGAFPLAPASADAALVLTLTPGAYTAVVTGVNNTSGNALIEIYEVP